MKYLSNKFTNYLLSKNIIQTNDSAIYEYGFQTFLELFTSIIFSIIIAFVLNMKLECIVFFIFFIPLRSFGGGLHMETYLTCLLLSCATLCAALLFVKYAVISCPVSFLVYLVSLFVLKVTGPVDHPDREVDAAENKAFIRRMNITLLLSLIAAFLFWCINSQKYLLLEAIVFLLVSVTSVIGKIKYSFS